MPKKLLNKSDLKPLPKGFKRVLTKKTFRLPALTLVMMMLALGFSLSNDDVLAYAATNNYNMTAYSSQVQYSAPTFSEFWYQDSQGNWHIQDNNGNTITNAWLCDDAVPSNGQNIWYLIDANGNMVSAGLVQDQTGNIYSLETSHNGYYGMLRYQSGAYDGVYLDLEASHGGSFAKIKNQDGVAGLQSIYGLTQVNIDNSNCVYTSSFRNSYQSNIPNGTDELKKEHPDDKVIVNGVDISQYLIDEETNRKTAEEYADWHHEGMNAPGLN